MMWGWMVLAGMVGYGVFLWSAYVLAKAAKDDNDEGRG